MCGRILGKQPLKEFPRNTEPNQALQTMNPLSIKPILDSEPSWFEKKIAKIPLIGEVIACELERSRFRPIAKEYSKILKDRDPDQALSLWNQEDLNMAKKIMEILNESMGWEFPRFIPGDPCYIAFWSFEDGLDVVEASENIESAWNIKFTEKEEKSTTDYTLQQLIDLIKLKSQPVASGQRR
jgi:hypothetical protein